MGKFRVLVLGSLVGVALALAPLSSAVADGGHWGHGGGHGYGGHGYYGGHGCYGCLWPLAVARETS